MKAYILKQADGVENLVSAWSTSPDMAKPTPTMWPRRPATWPRCPNLKRMLEAGILKPHVSVTFPFEQLAEAHRQVESGHTVGKAVVTLQDLI